MADNTFAAFDPLFWSFHAIFDRFFKGWIRETDKVVQWSSNFPQRPFIEDCASPINLDEGLVYSITTLGSMVGNAKRLRCSYGIPVSPDCVYPADRIEKKPVPVILVPRINLIMIITPLGSTNEECRVLP